MSETVPPVDDQVFWRQDANRARDARRLDAELWQLAHQRTQADRQLARGLAELWDQKLFQRLGWARATDFVREYLGIDGSRARWLAKIGRALRDVPELDEALANHTISMSQVYELRTIAMTITPEERAAWIERAADMTVRELRRAIRAWQQRQEEQPDIESNGQPEAVVIDVAAGRRDEDRPEGTWVSIDAPPRLALLWQDAVELARAATGRHLTLAQAAEVIFAEYLSGVGDDDPDEIARLDAEEQRRQLQEQVRALFRQAERRKRGATTNRRVEDQARETAAERWPTVDWQPPEHGIPSACLVENFRPWELAATLRRLCELKREVRYRLAAGLERLHDEFLWSALRFVSFEEYCERRLGFGKRTAQRLRRFRRGLDQYPRLRETHFRDGISYIAANRLLSVLDPATEEAWVEWADGLTYREIERVTEKADCYSLARATPKVFESYVQQLAAKGFVRGASTFEAAEDVSAQGHPATTFAWSDEGSACRDIAVAPPDPDDVPLGCALPPSALGESPTIVGIPDDLELLDPELCLARIRFWGPADVVDLIYHVIRRCRHVMPDSSRSTWSYVEVIIVHFIQSQDTPAAREVIRRHEIIARDRFRCTCPGCTGRDNLHGHHLEPRSQGGSDDPRNLTTICVFQHIHGIHEGVIVMGGHAPHWLVVKMGIDPVSGRALVCYVNERRVSEEVADQELARWRASLREGGNLIA